MAIRDTYIDSVKIKSTLTTRSYDSNIKDSSALAHGTIYENTSDATKSVDYSKIFVVARKILQNPDNVVNVRLKERTQRLDNLSSLLYGSPYLWWAIKIANPDKIGTPFSVIESDTVLKLIKREVLLNELRNT